MTAAYPLLLLCALVALLLASKTERAVIVPCDSGHYTNSGECCEECPPGEGVVKECGETQTVCTQCLDSETFSENYSHTEVCEPCTECTGLMRMDTPCTDSNNAKCVCNYNFFFSKVTGQCEPCTVCPVGQGVYSQCYHAHDTVCEECVDETFSDRESSLEPCLPCTICEEDTEQKLADCTPESDSVCHSNVNVALAEICSPFFIPSFILLHLFFAPQISVKVTSQLIYGVFTESCSKTMERSQFSDSPRFLGHGFNENLIPIYCSILAAGVVGLVAYIVFKRWNSCKQNKQAANNRAATNNQMVTPEGEKLHSDSGISVDSQSLQEQQQQLQQHAKAEVQAQRETLMSLNQPSKKKDNSKCLTESFYVHPGTQTQNLLRPLCYPNPNHVSKLFFNHNNSFYLKAPFRPPKDKLQ
uniref:Nerve growth factor receptor a (TNFR superfamily, member 16) n=1 Tax=Gouania willdenowi TaxID=441366 RepID=A0A8C5HIR6_GOUWI